MIKTKTETFLGFAVKSRKIIFGTENIVAFKKRKYLILLDAALSENTTHKLTEYANAQSIPLLVVKIPLAETLHRNGVKAIALIDPNMAAAIIKDLEKSEK